MMAGSILNALGIIIGAFAGLLLSRQISGPTQVAWRGLMGVMTVFIGLRITVLSLDGPPLHYLKEIAILVLALAFGRVAGRLLHLQKTFNRLGQYASRKYAETRPGDPHRFNDGFLVCTLVFCAGPLGPVGSVLAGLVNNYWEPLALKMAMDGLAAMGFACVFGWSVVLSALPVFVFQGLITLGAQECVPFLNEHRLLESVTGVGGLLVFCVALIVLNIKKFEMADYLPSLVMAPVITWLWS